MEKLSKAYLKHNALLKRVLKAIASVFCLILAILGFLLPILSGWFFVFLAILLISPKNGKKLIAKIKDKINSFRNKKNPPKA